ncbi:serine peptidase [Streptomyces sp. NPDC101249]|uniref:serine peptidase n=1 Tax=Streptomyces sp. NPDC101249 TaxID=3366140 RepID=UPI00381A0AB1
MTFLGVIPLRITAVHGVGGSFGFGIPDAQREDLRALKAAVWARQLCGGLGVPPERIDLDFAYYADRLANQPAQGGDDGLLDDPLAQEMLSSWAMQLGVPSEISQGHATVPLRALTTWVSRRYDLAEGPLRVFITMFFREVIAYLRAPDAPKRISAREEVAARIAQHRPRVVIAHSLGSVVAYEALQAHPELRPDLFLSLGSPLALPRVVFERLVPAPSRAEGASARGAALPGGTRWVNIADVGDPVAVPPSLSHYFNGIALDHSTTVGALYRFHHAENYLHSAVTAATLAPYLGL